MGLSSKVDADSVAGRIRWVLRKVWLDNQARMAADLGISPAAISYLTRGTHAPGTRFMAAISAHPLINPDWLLTGQGEPLIGTTSTGEEMLPLARQPLPGPAEKYRELLSREHLPTARFDLGPG